MTPKRLASKRVGFFRPLIWLSFLLVSSLVVTVVIGLSYTHIFWQAIDAFGTNLTLSLRTDTLTQVFISVTHFGYYGSLLIWLLIIGVLASKRDFSMLLVSLFLSAGGFLLGSGLKLLVARMRPSDFALISETSHSFPSLHAMTAIVLYLFVPYLVYYYSRKFLWSYLVFMFAVVMAIVIGLSRVYLAAHFLTDVLAGFSLGTAWFLLVLFSEKGLYVFMKKRGRSVKIS